MAITVSGIYVQNFIHQFDASQYALNITDASTYRICLLKNGLTPNFSTDVGYNTTGYQTYESAGASGSWLAGGVLLSQAATGGTSVVPTLTDSGGVMVYDHTNDVSVANTSVADAVACMIYTTRTDSPRAKNGLVLVYFGNANGYTTSGGTFQIAWSNSGVFSIDLTP